MWLEEGESLGISIVGGRTVIKRLKNGEELKGIFIKQVLPESPAGRTHALKTGDKILQVGNTLAHKQTHAHNTICSDVSQKNSQYNIGVSNSGTHGP